MITYKDFLTESEKYPLYKPRFNSGNIVYLKKEGKYTNLEVDSPYKVLYCQPKSISMMDLNIRGVGANNEHGVTVDSNDFMSFDEYHKKKTLSKSKEKELNDLGYSAQDFGFHSSGKDKIKVGDFVIVKKKTFSDGDPYEFYNKKGEVEKVHVNGNITVTLRGVDIGGDITDRKYRKSTISSTYSPSEYEKIDTDAKPEDKATNEPKTDGKFEVGDVCIFMRKVTSPIHMRDEDNGNVIKRYDVLPMYYNNKSCEILDYRLGTYKIKFSDGMISWCIGSCLKPHPKPTEKLSPIKKPSYSDDILIGPKKKTATQIKAQILVDTMTGKLKWEKTGSVGGMDYYRCNIDIDGSKHLSIVCSDSNYEEGRYAVIYLKKRGWSEGILIMRLEKLATIPDKIKESIKKNEDI